jgi:hypothetical protein
MAWQSDRARTVVRMHGGLGWDAAGGVHPVADTITAIATALDAVVGCPLYGLGPEAAGGLLAEVVALESRLASLRLRLVSAAELAGTAEHAGAPTPPPGCGPTVAPTGPPPGGR